MASPLFPTDNEFKDWWLAIFLWAFGSSLIVHFIAGIVASYQMRGKPFAFYIPILFVLYGALTITLSSSISSVVIVSVYKTSLFSLSRTEMVVWGIGQTAGVILTSLFHFYPTL
ncbi:transmembrane protein 170A-like [Corticium candelabrum]|uniref:transmembrane protein 170A-like n=1 Tax=Corticium candelabrum TaxID=121492 RepID=UPI002E257C74|nr:transmembrane protein 170A-like [Corticium candelabrum]